MTATTSTTESLILRRLAAVHQKTVAVAIGSDEGTVSRFASGERGLRIHQVGPAFDALGLKLVPINEVSIPREELEALRVLARKSLGGQEL